ncbi:MAG: acetate uptake transporter [Psychromonas sp.]
MPQTIKLANPAPLGLMGFGMTTVLLNIHNAGFFPLDSMILAMGLFVGGMGQVVAGILEFKKGNTFGLTAFTSYGFFWISLVALLFFPKLGLAEPTDPAFMAWYFIMYGIFTGFMFIATLRGSRVSQFIFASLTALFFLLAARDLMGSHAIGVFAGYVGIVCGLAAIYDAMAQVINEQYGKEVLPLG